MERESGEKEEEREEEKDIGGNEGAWLEKRTFLSLRRPMKQQIGSSLLAFVRMSPSASFQGGGGGAARKDEEEMCVCRA